LKFKIILLGLRQSDSTFIVRIMGTMSLRIMTLARMILSKMTLC
jgi:hypothetical protein